MGTSGRPPRKALATRSHSGTGPVPHLLIILDILVSQAHEQLPEVMPLVVLPPLHICLQVSIEALHPVLALLHSCWHLEGDHSHGSEVRLASPPVHASSNICRGPNAKLKRQNTLWKAEPWGSGSCGRVCQEHCPGPNIIQPIRAERHWNAALCVTGGWWLATL